VCVAPPVAVAAGGDNLAQAVYDTMDMDG
jgi:hypothetical protein